jgi:hypothetical protein
LKQISVVCAANNIPLFESPDPGELGPLVLLVFDEAHSLTHKPSMAASQRERTAFHNLGYVLTHLTRSRIFSLFMSTNSQVQELAPPSHEHPSLRIAPGRDLLPPITELLPFDIFAQNIATDKAMSLPVTLATAVDPDVFTRFGRPMCVTTFIHGVYDADFFSLFHFPTLILIPGGMQLSFKILTEGSSQLWRLPS